MKSKILKTSLAILAILIVAAVVGGTIFIRNFRNSDQFVQFDAEKLNEVYTALTVLDDSGNAISQPLYINNRKQIPLSALHDYTYKAFVAVEDKRFFQHDGVDIKRVLGALVHNIKSGGYKEGASTISQQLIKNTHLNNSKTVKRKLNEMMLAKELERHYSKEEILEMYLNTIYFGSNAYGIESAANVYFGKSATELTVSESAVLAGMIKAPNVYAPNKNIEKCTSRRDSVLKLMLNQGILDENTYLAAQNEQINCSKLIPHNEKNYLYFVMKEACKILNMTSTQLARSNFIIETYCNQSLQEKLCRLADNNADGSDFSAVVTNNQGGVQACLLRGESAGTKRQVGSALKPIAVYTPALNEKIISQASPVLDEETDFNGYKPTNAGGYNGWTTVKYAVAKSLNVPAVKTLNALTLPVAETYLSKLGIEGKQNLSLALGNTKEGMDVFSLADCYATLANGGAYNPTGFIKNIYSANGLVFSRELQNKPVFGAAATYLMTDMLVNTVKNGTAKRLASNFDIAAKTGTVGNREGNSDALVAGYTTENTFVVWLSGKLPNQINGATAPCQIASELLEDIYSEHKPTDFLPPSGVVRLGVDRENLYGNQLVTQCDGGEKFWFDVSLQPQKREIYNYTLNVTTQNNSVKITLPESNGTWKLFCNSDGKNRALPVTDNAFEGKIDKTTEYYAELYVKNRLVYTTPAVLVQVEESVNEPPFELPRLTDFWYWG